MQKSENQPVQIHSYIAVAWVAWKDCGLYSLMHLTREEVQSWAICLDVAFDGS